MKFNKICLLFLFLLFVSVGFASAGDVNQTNADVMLSSDADVLSASEDMSYADLEDLIYEPGDVIELSDDYEFTDGDKDYVNVKMEDGFTLTINGNNHVIDGNAKAGAFNFTNGKVIISNLTIRNCAKTPIILFNCELISENVVFENNSDELVAGVVFVYESAYSSYSDRFIDNYAPEGSAIYCENSSLYVDDSVFMNANPIQWSIIKGLDSNITVVNTLFENLTSKYATAVYNENGRTHIKGSRFANLLANLTAGAVAVKNSDLTVIEESEFINVSSYKNGGAIYADVNGRDLNPNGTTLINRTYFELCSSEFGGAVLQLGGNLQIIQSTFLDNAASFNGGAVYASNASLYANGVNFTQNKGLLDGYSNGGAILVDDGVAEITGSHFENNTASCGGGIYAYDTYFEVEDTAFFGNGEAIHGFFSKEGSSYHDVYQSKQNPDKFILDDEVYYSVADLAGNEIVLNPIEITGNVDDPYFDLRSFDAVTPVKNQGYMGACWAFGANGAMESAFLIATNKTLDLSENNLQNTLLKYSILGNPEMSEGGDLNMGFAYYLSWLGIVDAEYDTYDELGKISPLLFTPDCYHILDGILVNTSDIAAMKNALLNYGALTVYVNGADKGSKFFNPKTNSVYCNNESLGNHYVTLVGWNDTFSMDDFSITPPGDGAWICKNSWGTDWGDEGYFYLSYYDKVLRINNAAGYIINNTDVYGKLYQYDIGGFEGFYEYSVDVLNYTNEYESVDDDWISAVGTYFFDEGIDYTLYVAVNGNELYSQSGVSSYYGYHTIRLDKNICIKEGDNFTVTVQSNLMPFLSKTRLHFQNGKSYASCDGEIDDLVSQGMMACVKVYTKDDSFKTDDMQKYYSEDKPFVVDVAESGADVYVIIDGEILKATSDDDGIATFTLPMVDPGVYAIETVFNGISVINALTVLPDNDTDDDRGDGDDDYYPVPQKSWRIPLRYGSNAAGHAYSLYRASDMKLICHSSFVYLKDLIDLFNFNLTNGHLKVWIDGILVFEGDVGDDLLQVIFEIIEKFLGKHEMTVEFTDSNGKTQTLNETIIIE